jgi:hypothetical protein
MIQAFTRQTGSRLKPNELSRVDVDYMPRAQDGAQIGSDFGKQQSKKQGPGTQS